MYVVQRFRWLLPFWLARDAPGGAAANEPACVEYVRMPPSLAGGALVPSSVRAQAVAGQSSAA
jgi:hypothetical protein